jgi:hypothetical protein
MSNSESESKQIIFEETKRQQKSKKKKNKRKENKKDLEDLKINGYKLKHHQFVSDTH